MQKIIYIILLLMISPVFVEHISSDGFGGYNTPD
jgi:hypothetical protein